MANRSNTVQVDGLDHFSNDAFRNFLCHIGVKLLRFSKEEMKHTTKNTLIERSGCAFSPMSERTSSKMQFMNESVLSKAVPEPGDILLLWSSAWKSDQQDNDLSAIENHLSEIIRKRIQLTSFPVKTMLFLHAMIFPRVSLDQTGQIIQRRREFMLMRLRCLYDELAHWQKGLLFAILTPVDDSEVFHSVTSTISEDLISEEDKSSDLPASPAKKRRARSDTPKKPAERRPASVDSAFPKSTPEFIYIAVKKQDQLAGSQTAAKAHVEQRPLPFANVDDSNYCFEFRTILAWYRAAPTTDV